MVLDLPLSSCVMTCRGLALSEPPWLLCTLDSMRLTWRGHCRAGGVTEGGGQCRAWHTKGAQQRS